MKREVGLWIDHTKAVIMTVMGEKEKTRLERHLQRDQLQARRIGMDTVDKLSDRQIAAKVCQHDQR